MKNIFIPFFVCPLGEENTPHYIIYKVLLKLW